MSRADDLAAGLAADLAAELGAPAVDTTPEPVRRPATTRKVTEHDRAVLPRPAAEPFAAAELFLAPRQWSLPSVRRRGRSVSVGVGPLRIRLGRG